ncbi:tRNA uridine-5-carboxymethylaminomethyl(34) synthesis GTPase MnmE [Oleiharenicola lentus]|uniref:tRNA modification GTPase MnmE n=1 Tax=Oleiharenicola lentus TaxID=2508720 RepID=A0A4V1M666_9BACT|nr:tRNA uridine-5-carboxymethylaminomethyl(34) synthesis GTPase MnmE [Oleiharenicola lentus]RXK54329.1 tRNA uridine-5-carboxymethylaminomethyl(34) synthesis GTPase MnmE [Oleiharenicola lentus]
MSFPTDTIAALGTPAGTSAIAVVRASGPQVRAMVAAIFGVTPPPRHAQHADYRDAKGTLVDDVLFTFFAAPNSFTGEDTVEISCHGNPFIAQKILEDLFARGCRPAEAGEFSKRAFLNGRLDLSQAEAVMDLIHARSERALAAANQQLRGALGRQMELLISQLVNVLAIIEAYIDFPDEDLPAENRQAVLLQLEQLQTATARLLATSHYGAMLRDGIKTVILGEPNAGKSSLLNRLVGRERALVSAEPGTTRDYLEERILVGPHALRLIDTAGLNPAPSSLEKRGMDKTLEQAAEADLFLWVLDATRPLPALPASTAGRLSPANTIVVVNKSDLPAAPGLAVPTGYPCVPVSALTGIGLEELRTLVSGLADSFQVKTGDDLIAINARHAHALNQARQCLETATAKLCERGSTELVASDLRGALDAFGQISGKVDNEQVLDRLFSTFCIGK